MVRFKHRYLLCEVVSDDPRCRLSLEDRVLGGLVRDTIARVHGTPAPSASRVRGAIPQCLYRNSATSMQEGILPACVVSSSLHHILGEQRTPLPVFSQHLTRTIRTCQKFLIQYNRRQLLILLQNCTDEGEREAIQKSVARSCLLEEESAGEELSDSGGEEAAEAME
eukprot:bmy_05754T0